MIIASAILRKSDGRVWTGKRHSDAIRAAVKDGVTRVKRPEFEQGFVTDDNTFLDRKEAFTYAKEHNQLKDTKDPWAPPTLMSEDLW